MAVDVLFLGQFSIKLVPTFPDILWREADIATLNDDLNTTCLLLNSSTLQQQTKHIVLTKAYDVSVDVLMSGRGLVCNANICPDSFHTQVFQQGRSPRHCVPRAPLCLGASICFLASSTTSSGGDWVTCQFRCGCPLKSSADQPACNKIVVMLGSGSVAFGRETVEIFDVSFIGN